MKKLIHFDVNEKVREIYIEPHKTLLEVLRQELNLTGAKYGCGKGECGSCTVLVDGEAIPSCLTLAIRANGRSITTIEGLAKGDKLHPLQETFVEQSAMQCGYCTPGVILSATALLEENPDPTEDEVKQYLKGNLCRCGCYKEITNAVIATAEKSKLMK